MVRVVMVALLIASLFSGGLPVAARDSAVGTIYLTTLPSGADTWVDGAYIGRSPALIDALPDGKHTITAAKTGWVSREVHVTVSAQQPFQFVDFELQRDPAATPSDGMLALHAGAPIRSVRVDGSPVKLMPGNKVALGPGDHDVLIDTVRAQFQRHVVVYPDMTTNVILREGSESADRAIVVAPASNYLAPAEVTLDGKRIEIHHSGHVVNGMLGDATMRIDGQDTTFDTPPALVAGKLFLPLDLYVRIGAAPLRAH